MIAQIIFFIALALFLIILVRRFKSSSDLVGRSGAMLTTLGKGVGRIGSKFGDRVIAQAKKARHGIPLLSDKDGTKVGGINDHNFWREELPDEKQEIPGFFDEGDELFKKGEYKKAEEFFLKAATHNPSDARVYARLGVIYLNEKNYNDAIEALKVAVKFDKYNPSRHYNLALAYHGNTDRQKAISSVREAIALDPVTKKYRLFLENLMDRK